jgi:hypothetical protein
VRLDRVAVVRVAVAAVERPDLDVAHVLVTEVVVERKRLRVLHDALQPDALHAACPSLFVCSDHQHAAEASATRGRYDTEPADPRFRPAQAEVDETDGLAGLEGDARRHAVEVVGLREEVQGIRGDVHRADVALVRGREQLRELVVGEDSRGTELDISHGDERRRRPGPGATPPRDQVGDQAVAVTLAFFGALKAFFVMNRSVFSCASLSMICTGGDFIR